jgi:hypothetical protein
MLVLNENRDLLFTLQDIVPVRCVLWHMYILDWGDEYFIEATDDIVASLILGSTPAEVIYTLIWILEYVTDIHDNDHCLMDKDNHLKLVAKVTDFVKRHEEGQRMTQQTTVVKRPGSFGKISTTRYR